jgi:hypothetical protein
MLVQLARAFNIHSRDNKCHQAGGGDRFINGGVLAFLQLT